MNINLAGSVSLAFVIVVPFITFALLQAKGLPGFAQQDLEAVLIWAYQITWLAALFSGLIVSASLIGIVSRTDYFHAPYDFGRCFSLGAISGTLSEALCTWIYRTVTRHSFSSFWIAGEAIAGCLAGAVIVAAALKWLSNQEPKRELNKKRAAIPRH